MKAILGLIILIFLFGVVFSFLFKVGLILIVGLGIVYLVKKIITE